MICKLRDINVEGSLSWKNIGQNHKVPLTLELHMLLTIGLLNLTSPDHMENLIPGQMLLTNNMVLTVGLLSLNRLLLILG